MHDGPDGDARVLAWRVQERAHEGAVCGEERAREVDVDVLDGRREAAEQRGERGEGGGLRGECPGRGGPGRRRLEEGECAEGGAGFEGEGVHVWACIQWRSDAESETYERRWRG